MASFANSFTPKKNPFYAEQRLYRLHRPHLSLSFSLSIFRQAQCQYFKKHKKLLSIHFVIF